MTIKNNEGGPFYKVTLDGVDVKAVRNNYSIPIKEGMKVDVVTAFPDEKVKVAFNFLNDGKDFLEKVTVDGEEVTDYLSPDFMVQLGAKLVIYGNTSDYKFESLKCSNGVEQTNFFDSWETYIFGPLDITINATKYPSVNYIVEINDAEAVTVLKGSAYSQNQQELKDGVNNVSISSKNPTIFIKANDGYCIESITADDVEISETTAGSRTYKVPLSEGMKVVVETRAMVLDQKIVIFAQDASSVSGSWKIQSGYNLYEWDKSNLSLLKLNVYGSYDKRSVYLNGERCAPTSTGGTAFELRDLKNGDIIKIYPNGAPEICNVTFDVAEDAEPFLATHDIIKEFDVKEGLECFAGTRVTITPATDSHIKVSVNDNDIESEEESGSYIFVVEGNDKVKISNSSTVGVKELTTTDTESECIYNLQGIRIKDTTNLPAGIYIVNGKKMVR